MTLHRLKAWPVYYRHLIEGKTAELREDDRGYEVGDAIDIWEWDPNLSTYSGRHEVREITHISRLDFLGENLRGYVILSLREAEP